MPFFSILSKTTQAMNKPETLQILGPHHLPYAENLQNYMEAPICKHKGVFWCQSAVCRGQHRLGSWVINTTFFHFCTETAGALRKLCLVERAPHIFQALSPLKIERMPLQVSLSVFCSLSGTGVQRTSRSWTDGDIVLELVKTLKKKSVNVFSENHSIRIVWVERDIEDI